MNVLIVGGGAREHALAWKLKQSPRIGELFVAPGNAGTATIARNLDIAANDIERLAAAARARKMGLTIVGPEGALADGIVDLFHEQGLAIVGPTSGAARIESSKVFARDLMRRKGIPAAAGVVFDSYLAAKGYVESCPAPIVIKADGLAAGKGVVVAQSRGQALQALKDAMETKVFGASGEKVIVEECLSGREVSLLAFTDGATVTPMVPACDHKRVFAGDQGPNTGGMGSFSPPRFFDASLTRTVVRTILEPAIAGMAEAGTPFAGVLYAGLMLTEEGPKVLEFNARFGDPEAQAILPRLKTDLLEICLAIARKRLASVEIEWSPDPCVGVVLASGGYPGNYEKGFPIFGLEKTDPDVLVFHAGTRVAPDKGVVTDGGRVLTVAAMGHNMAEARRKVYDNIPRINFSGCHYRKDIALAEVD
ncbi:MAG: phosphoribosylamine--glycine ligase [Chloroflexi bacterium]|nr:phosphoribosylamine--glycine ligase [Chloroflexota bacterium]